MSTIPAGRLNHMALAHLVAKELQISQEDAANMIRVTLDVITRAVAAGHDVNITNFGTWMPRVKPEHKARNPQTGGRVVVPAKQLLRFRTAPRLAQIVGDSDRTASTRKLPSR